MPQIAIDIPTAAQATRIVSAIANAYDYNTTKLPNETQAAFAKRMIAVIVKQIVANEENRVARAATVLPGEIPVT